MQQQPTEDFAERMDRLLSETTSAAAKLFKGLQIRVWFIKLGKGELARWKCIVINVDNKVKLVDGPLRKTPEGAVSVVRNQLESIVGKSSKTS